MTASKTKVAKKYGLRVKQMDELVVWMGDDIRIIYYHPITKKKTGMYRVRRTGREGSGKYTQPAGTLPEAYYCPLFDWNAGLNDTSKPLYITEGELKAAKACVEGFACVGLGGVFCFQSRKKGVEWIPTLDHVNWEGRAVYIIFDSDGATNLMVRLAATQLAVQLMKRGAKVYVVFLPALPNGTKAGLDDYLIVYGKDSLDKLLEEAKPWNKHEHFHKLNSEVVYVEQPNSVVRLRDFLVMGTRDFRNDHYSDLEPYINERGKVCDTARDWMKWGASGAEPGSGRNKVAGLTFEPGGELFIDDPQKGRLLNTCRGWSVEPVKGDVTPYTDLHARLFGSLPAEHQKWVQQWFAYPIQHPGTKLHSAMMVVGAPGTGKTMLGIYLKTLCGEAGVLITQRELEADFNGWIANRQFVVGDEVMTKENRRQLCELMKTWITSDVVPVNKKHVERYYQPNKANFYLTSNHTDALQIEDDDRRYFVHEVTCDKMTPEEGCYFGEWIEKPQNQSALLYHLLHEVDCTGFQPKAAPPMTDAKAEMQAAARTALDSVLVELKKDPDNPELLHNDYKTACKVSGKAGGVPDEASPRDLGRMLFGDRCQYKPETIGRRLRHFKFACRVAKVGKTTARLYRLRYTVTPTVDLVRKRKTKK